MLLVGAGVNQKSWSALNALDSSGRLLWTYSGASGKRLQNLRTPVIGSDGTIYVNDALGVGQAIGPPTAGWLADWTLSFSGAFLLASGVSLVCQG